MNLAHAPVILDVAGLALDADDRRRLAHPLTGGIVLFARNWRDRRQLTELIAEVKSIRNDLLVCVDHEGGRVPASRRRADHGGRRGRRSRCCRRGRGRAPA